MHSQNDLNARLKKVEGELSQIKFCEANYQINPEYRVIEKYITEHTVNENEFRGRFESLIVSKEYGKFTVFLEKHDLSSEHNLYFFWVYLSGWYKGFHRAFIDKDYKIQNQYFKEIKSLKDRFEKFNLSSLCKTPEPYYLESIKIDFATESGVPDKMKITAPRILSEISEFISEWLIQFENPLQSEVNSKLHYFKLFIYKTIPLFEYLKDTHFKSKPKMRVYEFIADFLETIGISWVINLKTGDLPEQYLKARYNEFNRANKVTLLKQV